MVHTRDNTIVPECIQLLSQLFNIPPNVLIEATRNQSTQAAIEINLRSTILTSPHTYRTIFSFSNPPLEDILKKPTIIFVHVPKTAGTTLHKVVKQLTKGDITETFVSINAFPLFYLNSKSWIFGHIDRETALAVFRSRHPIFLTMLRRPLERYRSLYYFWRSHDPQKVPLKHIQLAVKLPPEAFFRHPHIRDLLWNEGVKLVVGIRTYNKLKRFLFTPPQNKLQKLVHTLVGLYARFVILKSLLGYKLIGFQEDLPSFIKDLQIFANKPDSTIQIPQENVTKIKKYPFSPETTEAVYSIAQLEFFMYKAARIIAPYKRAKLRLLQRLKRILLRSA